MPPLPRIIGRELVRALGKLGWEVVAQKGSHAHLKHSAQGGQVTVPLACLVEPEEDDGYYVTVPALPGCFTQGATIDECRERAAEAIEVHIAGKPTVSLSLRRLEDHNF